MSLPRISLFLLILVINFIDIKAMRTQQVFPKKIANNQLKDTYQDFQTNWNALIQTPQYNAFKEASAAFEASKNTVYATQNPKD